MSKNMLWITGVVFVVAAGFFFAIDKISHAIIWSGSIATGEYDSNPFKLQLDTNYFSITFLLVGIIFMLVALMKKENKPTN